VRRPGLDAGPAQWSVVPFAKALRDDTAGQVKIFRRDYGSSGELPIIDQGAEKIAGYTDDRSAAYQGALPVILFGDHTRVFKYVDSPFALGADGVKALQPAPSFEPKFLYYYLINADIPGRGYSRHFKFLREIHFPLAAPSEQRRIVEILDQADRLHRLRAEADVKAGRILPALFITMFGDPATNPMRWPERPFGSLLLEPPRNGLSPSTGGGVRGRVLTLSAITRDAFDENASKEAWFAHQPAANRYVDHRDFLICRGNGNLRLVGRGRFARQSAADLVFPDTMIAARVDLDQVDRAYLETLWLSQCLRAKIESRARTTSGIHKINQNVIRSLQIQVPPIALQRRFGHFAHALETAPRHEATNRLDRLFGVLLHRAFSGRLTRRWRKAHMRELLEEMERQARALGMSSRPE